MFSELRFVKWKVYCNCIVKWVFFFASLLALRLSARKPEIKNKNSDDVHWNVWMNRIPNVRYRIIYTLLHFFFFFFEWRRGTAVGRFSQCFFFIFRRWPTMVAEIFTLSKLKSFQRSCIIITSPIKCKLLKNLHFIS